MLVILDARYIWNLRIVLHPRGYGNQ